MKIDLPEIRYHVSASADIYVTNYLVRRICPRANRVKPFNSKSYALKFFTNKDIKDHFYFVSERMEWIYANRICSCT